MSTHVETQTNDELTLQSATVGYPHVPASTLLTRLNYFDGKFLRADDLRTEQEYHRRHVELSNRGGGSGVVEGFDVSTGGSGDLLAIGAGLAIDGAGRVLYLPDGFSASLADIVAKSSRAAELVKASRNGSSKFAHCVDGETKDGSGGLAPGAEFYKLSIAHAEDACGNEDVYGKLCEDACATDEQRRYLVEGIVLRATPFRPRSPFPTSKAVALTERHVRSQLASAWFADEAAIHGTPMSAEWIRSSVWCHASSRETGSEVPIAIVGRLGTGLFVDVWIVRRERIDVPPRRYWAWNMAMRPWEVFLAQILQFQCQLSSKTKNGGTPGFTDPCQPHADALEQAELYIQQVEVSRQKMIKKAAADMPALDIDLTQLREKFEKLRTSVSAPAQTLLDAGIVELPSAGYLPVLPGGKPSVEDQVRRLMGEGVDLRFCSVRTDYVPHAVEEAQHMERISLLTGLDNPEAKPKVDILVPDATIAETKAPVTDLLFDTEVVFAPRAPLPLLAAESATRVSGPVGLHGAGRAKKLDSGGAAFYFAGASELEASVDAAKLFDAFTNVADPSADPTPATVIDEASTPASGSFTEVTEPLPPSEARARIVNLIGDVGGQAKEFIAADKTAGAVIFTPKPVDPAPLSLWAELESAENPFKLELLQSTKVSLLLDMAAFAKQAVLATVDLHGQLVVRRKGKVANGTVLYCQFTGKSAIESSLGGKSTPGTHGSPNFPVTLTLTKTASGPRLLVALMLNKLVQVEFVGQWNEGHPLKISVLAGYVGAAVNKVKSVAARNEAVGVIGTQTFALPLFVALLKEDASVAKDANDLHRIALHTLDVIEAGLGKSDFAETAAAKLFPAPAAVTDRSLVATRDWVLFQRRRISDCLGPPAPIPVPEPVRVDTVRYRVYETTAREALVQKFLYAGNEDRLKPILTPVGDVEFIADSDTLSSDPSTLAGDWSAVSPEATIVYAAVVTDQTEPQLTLESRARAYEDAVSGVSSTDADATLEFFGGMPGLQDGADGFLVFVTSGVRAVKHCVYVANSDIQSVQVALKKLPEDGDVATFAKTKGVSDLGSIEFEPGTDQPVEPTTLDTLPNVGMPPYVPGTLSLQEATSRVAPDDDVVAQVKKICEVVQSNGAPSRDDRIVTQTVDVDLPCPIVTVLVVNSG